MSITLKPMLDSDLEAFYDLMNDVDLARNAATVPYPITREWAQKRLAKKREGEANGTAFERGLYIDNLLVGTIGWFIDDRGFTAIGYAIHRNQRGKGLATIAARMIVSVLREAGHDGPIYADYFQDNPASGRVLEKVGFVRLRADTGYSAGRLTTSPSWVMVLAPDGVPEKTLEKAPE